MQSGNRLMNNKHDEDEVTRLTASLSQVMRSLRSFSFLRPANAIFVPGMYCEGMELRRESGNDVATVTHLFGVLKVFEEGVLIPGDALVHVRSGVRIALRLASLAAEKPTKAQRHVSIIVCFKSQRREKPNEEVIAETRVM